MKNKSRFKIARAMLIFWCLFIGIGALIGGIAMLIKPDGSLLQMQDVLKYFEVLPFSDVLFQDYFFSGIALIIVNGITNIVAAILLLKKKKSGIILGGLFGITLMLWICIQFYIFPKEIIQLSLTYFIFGILQVIIGYSTWVFYNQEIFCINESGYENLGKNKKELVVYFSRLGYTKKIAYEEAERLNAEIYEVKTQEPTSGTSGFWWCGYFAITGKNMTINEINIDLTKYDHVTICSPIWVFDICNPIKSFCKQSKGKIKSASYILVHYTNLKYKKAIQKTDKILGIKHKTITNIICKIGKMKKLGKILIILFILIIIFIAFFIYTVKIKITDITELVNEKSNYKIIFQAVGEPEWPFGRTKVRVTLVNSNGKRIRSFEEYISNDGAIAQKENIKVNWYEDYVEIILIGQEQEDDIHKIDFKN